MIPQPLAMLLTAVQLADPRVQVWSREPHLTEEEDATTDDFACHQISALVTGLAVRHGLVARTIHADTFDNPWVLEHRWSEVDVDGITYCVDFTARQFHNADALAARLALSAPWPLVWPRVDRFAHPIVGRFLARQIITVPQGNTIRED